MSITIFGMGYVGCVTLAALSSLGHKIEGIEVDPDKLDMLKSGVPPVNEPGIKELIVKGLKNKLISFKSTYKEPSSSSIFIICVGTPSNASGNVNLTYIDNCILNILKTSKNRDIIVAIRSTVPPDYIESHLNIRIPKNVQIIANPEFLREGSALSDFMNPPFTLIGTDNEAKILDYINLFKEINSNCVLTSFSAAFLVKYASNVFHALKATFANEIGMISESLNVDTNEVLKIFCMDENLNISKKYLKHGYAIGGSCLPKDIKAVLKIAEANDVELKMLKSINESNDYLIRSTSKKILDTEKNNIGFYGITFKQRY